MQKVQQFMDSVQEWADATFGAKRKVTAVLHHLKQEVPELIEAIEQNKSEKEIQLEFADVFILILNAASKHGLSANDLMLNAELKMSINRNRKWGTPDANGVVNHDRSLDKKHTPEDTRSDLEALIFVNINSKWVKDNEELNPYVKKIADDIQEQFELIHKTQ